MAQQDARGVPVEEPAQGSGPPAAADVPELDEELARLGGVVGGTVDELWSLLEVVVVVVVVEEEVEEEVEVFSF